MNVLIVDDNHTNCQLLRAVLEGEGHSVIVAEDDHEALVLLERRPVDAIISDLLMPNFDGHRLGKEIRRDKRWRDIPLICYTAVNGSLNNEKVAYDLGADAYLRFDGRDSSCSKSAQIISRRNGRLERVRPAQAGESDR
jgi:CheY-like chemotaxis protein